MRTFVAAWTVVAARSDNKGTRSCISGLFEVVEMCEFEKKWTQKLEVVFWGIFRWNYI
jgi:hypothetical protein